MNVLHETINLLSNKEIRQCQRFLFVLHAEALHPVHKLFDVLISNGATKMFDKQQTYQAVAPDSAYNDVRMRKWMSLLKKGIDAFLLWRQMEDSGLEKEIALCRVYNQRDHRGLFEQQFSKAKRLIETKGGWSSEAMLESYQLYHERYEFVTRHQREGHQELQLIIEKLDNFHALEILKRTCHLMSHQAVRPEELDKSQIAAALNFADQSRTGSPAFHIYATIYRLFDETEQERSFGTLKEAIDQHWQAFPLGEIRDIYLLTINYCIRRLNQGQRAYLREAFDLYRVALDRQLLYENGTLSPFTYKNLCAIAVSLGEFKWAKQFLEREKMQLNPDLRENIYKYNLAIFLYKSEDLQGAMQLLRELEFSDVFNNLTYRTLLLRIYFQLGEWQALDYLLDSFVAFLYRQKKVGYHKTLYLNLIKVMRKIMRSDLSDRRVCESLAAIVRNETRIAEKDWLLAQLTPTST